MGLEESTGGLNVKDVLPIVNGNIVPGYKFNHASPIEKESEYFRSNPEKGDRVHCVVFVVDANILGQNNVSDGTRRNIKEINEELRREDVPSFVLLTKIDNLCELVEKDIRNTYSSEKVKQAVDIAVELYNVPEQNIFPIKNYHCETERDTNKEILILLALKQMMYFGTDFLRST
ncbi:interferon-induced protein 44-like [Ruditapes philippinarum]|uniref:interferon-induced protein 44-like n=1 Tax=Ruditapes philippinarum TaxID=129788 RepID=UPI00295A9B2A|nr:interferon-induced protein 44-like [Ruditapes philippinarum]